MHPEIDEIGYHCRDYFVKQWDRFSHVHWGVLAHSTHLRGAGTYDAETGEERLRVQVTLATGIPRSRCRAANLGYLDPATVDSPTLRRPTRTRWWSRTPGRSSSGCAERSSLRTTSLTGSTIGPRLGVAPPTGGDQVLRRR